MAIRDLLNNGEWDDLINKLDELEIPLEKLTKFTDQDFDKLGICIVERAKLRKVLEKLKVESPECNNDIVNNYPTLISHEYARIFELLRKNQYFGLMLQIKDVFEVILKFPVLIAIADIFHKNTRDSSDNRILLRLLEKPLSLGDWVSLSAELRKNNNFNSNILEILKKLHPFFEKHKLAKWRNDNIGHGALVLKVDDAFLKDVYDKINLINKILIECQQNYNKILVYAGDGPSISLIGNEVLEQLTSKMELYACIGSKTIKGRPLISIEDQSIYLFDSFISLKKNVSMLDYIQGKKMENFEEMESWIDKNFPHLKRSDSLENIQSAAKVDDGAYSIRDEVIMEKLWDVDDFLEPEHLTNWFEDCLKNYDRGVFLLQMERGTGKSTYVRSLDERSGISGSIKDNNLLIRGYYINDSYTYRTNVFTQKINDLLRIDSNDSLIIRGIEAVSSKSANKNQDFADTINQYVKEYRSGSYAREAEKVIVILDGLDEIPASNDDTIFDFIPSHEQLNEGVFIFTTCRTNDEVSLFTKNKLKTLKFEEIKEQKTDSPEYQKLILTYIKEQLKDYIASDEDANKLAEKSEYRFLYIRILKELFDNKMIKEINEIPENNLLFQTYLEHLYANYGGKYYYKLLDLLIAIGSSFEAITTNELAYLIGEERITFHLLAHLIDMRSFLRIERSKRGNVLSLSHDDWTKKVHHHFNQEIQTFSQKQVERAMFLMQKELPWSDRRFDGEVYLLAYLRSYIEQSNDGSQLDKDHSRALKKIAYNLTEESLKEYQRERTLLIYDTVLSLELKDGSAEEIAWTYLHKGCVHETLMQYDDALHCYEKGIERVNDSNPVWALLHAAKGALYRERGKPSEGIQLLDEAITKLEKLHDQGMYQDTEKLAEIYKERGYTKRKACATLLDEALADLQTAYELFQGLMNDGKPIKEELYSSILMNRGAFFNDIKQYNKAVKDYEEARTIRDKLTENGRIRDKSLLCSTLMNLGYAYFCSGLDSDYLKKGEQTCVEAIDLCYKLQSTGELPNEDYIASAYTFLGKGYESHKHYKKACEQFNKGIIVKEKLLSRNKLPNPQSLEELYKMRDNCSTKSHEEY